MIYKLITWKIDISFLSNYPRGVLEGTVHALM